MLHELVKSKFNEYLDESFDDGTIDLILADPPYNISRETGFKSGKLKKFNVVDMDFGDWDHYKIDMDLFLHLAYSKLRKGGTLIVWYDIWKLSKLAEDMRYFNFKMLRQIIWSKSNPVPINMKATYLSNSREMAIVTVKGGKPTFNSEYDRGEYIFPIPQPRIHPTQKPLGLFSQLILKHSNEGDLVVDPFSGSGTTMIACYNHDREFMGCEPNQEYYDKALKRLEDEKK